MPQEREDIIRSAMAWRQEKAKHRDNRAGPEEPPPHPGPNGDDNDEPLSVEAASTMAAGAKPRRSFLDSASIMPHRNVVMLGGDGGTGKSLLALQLALACSTASPWLGLDVDQGAVVYVSAEDDPDEIKLRMREICEAEGVELGEAFTLYVANLVGRDAVLAVEDKGRMVPTPLFRSLRLTVAEIRPILVVIDNLADAFAGNENNRSLAKQFIGLLRGLALDYDCVVLLLAHPSLSGLREGTGTSGSTAWSNSVRSRLYLHRLGEADADRNARVLESMKANYAAAGGRFNLAWRKGRFVRQEIGSAWDRITKADVERVREKIASGLYRFNEQSPMWAGHAVAEVLGLDIGQALPARDRSDLQKRQRADVRTYLAGWVQARQLFIVPGLDAHRIPTQFYAIEEGQG
jgi:KaiC/GvpD/RAD55 family RecA-like ATPase